jgi:hypothetical protein
LPSRAKPLVHHRHDTTASPRDLVSCGGRPRPALALSRLKIALGIGYGCSKAASAARDVTRCLQESIMAADLILPNRRATVADMVQLPGVESGVNHDVLYTML